MVRNVNGGSKTKSVARKSNTPAVSIDYHPTNELEKIARVTKMYGNGMCQVLTQDHPQMDLMCYIRGKFRGRSKKHNIISVHSKVVIGLRDWENPYKNSDLISVLSSYDDQININGSSMNTQSIDDSFIFSTEEIRDNNEILPQKIPSGTIVEEDDEINIDDI
jgi:hypothetical protein